MSTRGPDPMVTREELRQQIKSFNLPFVTASDMADELGVARQTAHKHLQRMVDDGRLQKHKVGSSAVIWWLPDEDD